MKRSSIWHQGRTVAPVLLATCPILLGLQSLAQSVLAHAFLTVDGGNPITIPLDRTEKGWTIQRGFEVGSEGLGWRVSFTEGTFNPDPFIAYGIAVTDFGAPSIFGFAFFTPIVATGVPNLVNASLAGALNDVTGNGVALTPTGPLVQTSALTAPATGMGVDIGPAFAAPPAVAGAFYTYGPFSSGPIAGPGPGPWTGLSITTGFGLSGSGDIAVLTGRAEIIAVPEVNGGVVLGGLALVGGIALRRRMKWGRTSTP